MASNTTRDEQDGSSQTEELASSEQALKREKRRSQHEQWMRVMMEGQSTPDLRYQKHPPTNK